MSTINKFTVPQVLGSSRSSKRTYTHAVICQFDAERFAAELPDRLSRILTRTSLVENFGYYTLVAEVGVGSVVKVSGSVVTVTKIEYRQARGIGSRINGQHILHIIYDLNGKECAYPKRFARLV